MSAELPLARAAALRPFLFWLEGEGVPLQRAFAVAHLAAYPWERPEAPTPFAGMFTFLGIVARREGLWDMGCRSYGARTLTDFGLIGHALAGARTPREALMRASRAMPYFSSHERIWIDTARQHPVVCAAFLGAFDPAGLHIAQQLTAMTLSGLVEAAGAGERQLRLVEIVPWDGVRIRELQRWLHGEVRPSVCGTLVLHFRQGALDRPYAAPLALLQPAPPLAAQWVRLNEQLSLVEAVRIQIEEMLVEGKPTLRDVAHATGVSARTLQRLLAAADTAFTSVLDEARRIHALAAIEGTAEPFGAISAGLGYSSQACLSRAVRRWAAKSPREIRRFSRQPGKGA
ncbi:helix-turn-helix domain-containing protein [Afifella pfennigii]|uniref:helix-turn-helix domain-containing protein n=1 Tax=Afifella pfennigii TaxID=209897 RepID=UPI00047DBDAD|nr:AraC family transcriptional regulator [Afifella pfennigii]